MKKERQGSKDLLHSCGSFRVAHNVIAALRWQGIENQKFGIITEAD